MQVTNIGWTDFSVNMLKYRNAEGKTVWGCVHASEGCRFCYAEALAKRWGRGEAFTAESMKGLTPYFDEKEAKEVLRSKKIVGKKVFVDDMTDWAGEWVSDDIMDLHIAICALRSDVTFQFLTKRAERQCRYFQERFVENETHLSAAACWASKMAHNLINHGLCKARSDESDDGSDWLYEELLSAARNDFPNIHLGVSVEDGDKRRLANLCDTPASVRWASLEPYLAHMEFDHFIAELDGIVIGGESGPKHREMPLQSALTMARKANEAGVSVYFKQDSGPRPGTQGRIPDDIWALKEWPVESR